jgi:DEAD/DEAH box helicase domain-containing protein
MAQLDSLNLSRVLRDRIADFALDLNYIRNAELARICRSIWSSSVPQEGLVSDLWVEGAFGAAHSKESLQSLSDRGEFCAELAQQLAKTGAFPSDQLLYTHQLESLLQSNTARDYRPGIIVTAGTGAGKTESFLLPILNELFSTTRKGPGVRCIILYPMNALVNDQVDRLDRWLKGQKKLRFLHFTSETPANRARWEERLGFPEFS